MTADWKDALRAMGAKDPEPEQTQQSAAEYEPRNGVLTIFYEKKGRAGKPATIIAGFDTDQRAEEQLKQTASKLKGMLAVGGSARGGEILLQGDCRVKAAEALRKLGFKVK